VRLNKPDRYVVMEETVPIMARMPANKARLDGEIPSQLEQLRREPGAYLSAAGAGRSWR